MSTIGLGSLAFSELFPPLKLDGAADLDAIDLGADCLDELPHDHMMELLHELGNDLDEEHANVRERAPDMTPGSPCSTDTTEETGDASDKPSTTRVRTYTARKMEIARLLKELPDLESYVEFLKHQAAKAHNQTDSLQKTRLVNSSLRESVHQQQYTLARLQSAMSLYRTRQERMVPMDTFIQLPRDMAKRAHTVTALRPRIVRDATRFMRERTSFVDLGVASTETNSFVRSSAEACCVERFCVFPVSGPASVKQVYDALLFFIPRMDVMIAESTGDVTTREEASDLSAIHAVQSRQTRTLPNGLTTESNVVTFGDYQAQDEEFGGGRAVGTIAVNAVDKDELYPYSPEKRLRYDITSVIVVKTYAWNTKKPSGGEDSSTRRRGGDSRSRFGLAMACHTFVKLHRGGLSLSSRELSEACARLVFKGNLLFDTVQASVDISAADSATGGASGEP